MDTNLIAAIGRSLFGVVVALLRPTVRGRDGAIAVDASQRRLLPLQSGVLTAQCAGDWAEVTVEQTLTNPHTQTLRLVSTMPLPRSAVVSDLTLGVANASIQAGIRERRAARALFNMRCRGGGEATLLSEDAPGIVSHEVAGLAAQRSLRAVLRFGYQLPAGVLGSSRLRLVVHFEAAATAVEPAPPRRRMVRMGNGRALDSLFGIDGCSGPPMRTWIPRVLRGGRGRHSPSSHPLDAGAADASRTDPTQLPPADESDVLVSHDNPTCSAAAWCGELAGRRVRVVASARPVTGPTPVSIWSHAAQDLVQLMCRYAEAASGGSERGRLAACIAEIGLHHRLVTLWTSLVAMPGRALPHRRDRHGALAEA